MKPEAILKGGKAAVQGVKRAHKHSKKSMDTAVRVRGFKLMKLMRREIREGAPGGRRFARLSLMRRIERAQFSSAGRLAADKPLRSLARAVGYEVPRNDPLNMTIGFVGRASSVTWRRLARKQQEGFTTSTQEPYFRNQAKSTEEFLREIGSQVNHKMFGGRKSLRRNVFFLRKTTSSLRTPARPIIGPFWNAHRAEAVVKIRRDFRLKMMGQRI